MLSDREFLEKLISISPKTIAKIGLSRPPSYIHRIKFDLLDGATGSDFLARKTVMTVWGKHGRHAPEKHDFAYSVALMVARGRGACKEKELTHATRQNLETRLAHLAKQLAKEEIPINYVLLLEDVKFFGPNIKQKWQRSFFAAQQDLEKEEPTT